ncbi:MAG: 2-C-methyl-D-erythritol 2,4-cyclodiphosphate synthase [Rikenellaceae bacterium]
MMYRIGHGYDVHALADALPLWIGGVKIEHTKGAVAHSDGDVLIHAICDALLGALALGDIGKHFPDTSDEFKNIDSKILLSRTMELISARGYKIVNLDTTLALERPKIGRYSDEMREVLSKIMNITASEISIKATTREKLGFVGREEGVEAWAVVLLEKSTHFQCFKK